MPLNIFNNRKRKSVHSKLDSMRASILSQKFRNMISKPKSKIDTRKLNNKLDHLFRMKNGWNSRTVKNRVHERKVKSPNKSFSRKMSFRERKGYKPVISPIKGGPLYDPLENIDRLPSSPVGNTLYDPHTDLNNLTHKVEPYDLRLSPIPRPVLRRPVLRRPVVKKPQRVFNSSIVNKRFIP